MNLHAVNHTPEILAPAGSQEALLAALRCGADAVYVGGKQYSARQSAANFDLDELKQAADLCHLYGAKLYLTVNTMILEEELTAFCDYIRQAAAIGVDACIVQDLGVAHIIHQMIPGMPLHASTQMTLHTKEGALWAKEFGFTRVVTARELSREELQPMLECGLEIEHFVHGALCMSVSGQCYLSAMIGSRSANRGRCAQACRLPFSANEQPSAADAVLSLKDQSLVLHEMTMMQDGVTSLKIEGRMKRPEYVAAAVTALYQARSGETPDMDVLRAVFSRSGFTDGYYTGQRKNMFGVREKEDVVAARDILPQLQQLYRKPRHCIPVQFQVSFRTDKPVVLTAVSADGATVTVTGEVVQAAQKRPADEAYLRRQLEKLGDTVYVLEQFDADCDGVGMLSAAALNALRRDCIAQLNAERIRRNTPVYEMKSKPVPAAMPLVSPLPRLRMRLHSSQQWDDLSKQDDICRIIPVEMAAALIPTERDMLQPPRFTVDEPALMQQLIHLHELGWKHLVCENPAHIRMGAAIGFVLHGGMDLHIANAMSLDLCREYGLQDAVVSPEITLKQAEKITGILPMGIYAYGKLPVMLMRCCPAQNAVGCRRCTHALTDRTNRKFSLRCQKTYTELLNAVPVWMADRLPEMAFADFLLLDVNENDDAVSIAAAYRTGSHQQPKELTRGLLYRGVE